MFLYSDINYEVGEQGSSELVYDEDDIAQSIYTILGTRKGSRVFRPEFGSDLESVLFEPISEEARYQIIREIYESIGRWESRIVLTETMVNIDWDLPGYVCSLLFYIPLLNKSGNLAFSLKSRL